MLIKDCDIPVVRPTRADKSGTARGRLAKSSVTHKLLKMTVYPEDMFLDMGNERTTEEETISNISYNEITQSEIEP